MAVANSSPFNPVVFFDASTGSQEAGRMKIELFVDVVPEWAENFRQFCPGEFRKDGVPTGYKGSTFHRVVKEFMIQDIDCVNGDGTAVASIYQGPFADEHFLKILFIYLFIKHRRSAPGLLSTANRGPGTVTVVGSSSRVQRDWLDGKMQCSGKITGGLLVTRKMESVPTGRIAKPKLPVVISQCGECKLDQD